MEYSLDYINTVKLLIITILFYLVYSLSSTTPNTVIYMQQTNIDSSYLTPEGWASPY
jgi:hypothetical protein